MRAGKRAAAEAAARKAEQRGEVVVRTEPGPPAVRGIEVRCAWCTGPTRLSDKPPELTEDPYGAGEQGVMMAYGEVVCTRCGHNSRFGLPVKRPSLPALPAPDMSGGCMSTEVQGDANARGLRVAEWGDRFRLRSGRGDG